MGRMAADVLLVSLGSTAGWRAADRAFADGLREAGATVEVVTAAPQTDVRTFMLTDLRWALAARRAAAAGIAAHAPRAIVYSTTTAALLWPQRGAIRFDAPAAVNRPGRHGLWQRPLERRRLRDATALFPMSEAGLAEVPSGHAEAVVVPIAVEPSGPPAAERDIAAITYARNPDKKGLDRVLAAWALARRDGEVLYVEGVEGEDRDGVVHLGALGTGEYRALLRRARVYVTAPRREDHGLAQLEALADGCILVTNEAPGPYAALPIARAIDPRLVVPADPTPSELATAIRLALDGECGLGGSYDLQGRTHPRIPGRGEVVRVLKDEVLPRLLGALA